MAGFIEDLYFGNMEKQGHNIRNSDCAYEEIQTIIEQEKYLMKNLPKEFRSRFMEYLDAWVLHAMSLLFIASKPDFALELNIL